MDQSFVHSALELTAPSALLEEALTRESPDELLALLYRQMRALAGPRQDLDDLVQAAAERALKALERFEGRCALSTFTYGIVYRTETILPSGLVSLLWGVFPMISTLGGHFYLPGERLKTRQWLGFGVGFSGLFLLFVTDLRSFGPEGVPAALVLFLSVYPVRFLFPSLYLFTFSLFLVPLSSSAAWAYHPITVRTMELSHFLLFSQSVSFRFHQSI